MSEQDLPKIQIKEIEISNTNELLVSLSIEDVEAELDLSSLELDKESGKLMLNGQPITIIEDPSIIVTNPYIDAIPVLYQLDKDGAPKFGEGLNIATTMTVDVRGQDAHVITPDISKIPYYLNVLYHEPYIDDTWGKPGAGTVTVTGEVPYEEGGISTDAATIRLSQDAFRSGLSENSAIENYEAISVTANKLDVITPYDGEGVEFRFLASNGKDIPSANFNTNTLQKEGANLRDALTSSIEKTENMNKAISMIGGLKPMLNDEPDSRIMPGSTPSTGQGQSASRYGPGG